MEKLVRFRIRLISKGNFTNLFGASWKELIKRGEIVLKLFLRTHNCHASTSNCNSMGRSTMHKHDAQVWK
ncbi:hypothetical protein K7X08_004021 [Anisodus acutangulus]|uniref:Uncharacterized protein n=1 Tax=Anisodus acutangulus TaxID=402998 RepID=A0A9Q1RH19_9SOLA|nr:hypothetical protein K7X08_004021 [Anisodus acutangulus]